MKNISSALDAHLSGDTLTVCTCWQITRTDGIVMGFTDHDQDLTVDGLLYKAQAGYTRMALANSGTLSVDEVQAHGLLDDAAITERDLRAGRYDYAEVHLFLVNYNDLTQGRLRLRYGRFGEVKLSPSGMFQVELRGLVQLFNQQIGRTLQPRCTADLGDTRCKVQLIANDRQAGKAYAVGDRVKVYDAAGVKIANLPLPNGDFSSNYVTALANWQLVNFISSNTGADTGTWCAISTNWISSVKQVVVASSYYYAAGPVVVKARTKAANTNQECRLYVSFKNASGTEIANAYTSYASSGTSYNDVTVSTSISASSVHSIEVSVQTRLKTTLDPATVWAQANATFVDNVSCTLSGTELLSETGFEPAVNALAAPAGWADIGLAGFKAVQSWFNGITAPTVGGWFLAASGGYWGMQGGITYTLRSSYTPITGLSGITDTDIDTGGYVLEVDWKQINDSLGTVAGIGLLFTNANGTTTTVNSDKAVTAPPMEWRSRSLSVAVPVGARQVQLLIDYAVENPTQNYSVCTSMVSDIVLTLKPVNYDQNAYENYGGVEYVATVAGTSSSNPVVGWSRTIGATIVDGGVTWLVSQPKYVFLGHVTAVASRAIFTVDGFTSVADNWLQWGLCKFVTGENAPFTRQIIAQTGNVIEMMEPPPYKPAVGDIVILVTGCDKRMLTCNGKFANQINHRGYPFVPGTNLYFKWGSPL